MHKFKHPMLVESLFYAIFYEARLCDDLASGKLTKKYIVSTDRSASACLNLGKTVFKFKRNGFFRRLFCKDFSTLSSSDSNSINAIH